VEQNNNLFCWPSHLVGDDVEPSVAEGHDDGTPCSQQNSQDVVHARLLEGGSRELIKPVSEDLAELETNLRAEIALLDEQAATETEAAKPPSVEAGLLPVLLQRLAQEGGQPSLTCKNLAMVMEHYNTLAPIDKHKGKANRRTLPERLMECGRTPSIATDNGKDWFTESIVYVRGQKGELRAGFHARVIRLFEKLHGKWVTVLLSTDIVDKRKRIHKSTNINHRMDVELVRISPARSHGGSVCWVQHQVFGTRRVHNILASDAYPLPGIHLVHNALKVLPPGCTGVPPAPVATHTNFKNIAIALTAEIDSDMLCVEQLRISCICLHLTSLEAMARSTSLIFVKQSGMQVMVTMDQDWRGCPHAVPTLVNKRHKHNVSPDNCLYIIIPRY
jgi:hypothetical protein